MDTIITTLLLSCLSLYNAAASLECHCAGCKDTTYCTTTQEGACYTLATDSNHLLTGCLPPGLAALMCQSDSSIQCCHNNHCNQVAAGNQRFLRSEEEATPMPDNAILLGIVIAVVVVVTIVIVSLVLAALGCILYRRQKRKTQHPVSTIEAPPTPEVRCTTHTNSNCRAILPQSESIGSLIKAAMFYGDPLSPLVQRSIAQRTLLEKYLTKGSFSSRYIGRWREDRVAVTVFTSKHQHLWANETTILQLPLMRHDGILSFIAADTVIKKTTDYHYLISEYHARGSLREYLVKTTLEIPEALLLVTSLVCGVEYLHSQLAQESKGVLVVKPCVAHGNLTSQNVYVDKSGSCCLSDFALSVTQSGRGNVCGHSAHSDVRYRPPEALAATATEDVGFEGLKRADVYALGLLLWEVANSCLGEDGVYSLPYSDLLNSEATPTRDEMMRIVCEEGKRPPLPEQCAGEEKTRLVLATIEECWSSSPSQRPTAQQIKDTLQTSLSPAIEWQASVDKNGQTVYKQLTA